MTPRTLLAGGMIALMTGLHGYLLSQEQVWTFTEESEIARSEQDPLLTLRYIASARQENLRKFGLDDDLIERVVRRIETMQAEHGRRLTRLLKNAGDPQAVADALCGEISSIRPRYSAMPFLVEESGGERRVLDLAKLQTIVAQPWAESASIAGVYGEVELAGEDRREDATLMGVAAILLAEEGSVFEGQPPWGSGLLATWSWEEVQERFPRAKGLVVDYFASTHLVVELAQQEGGICD